MLLLKRTVSRARAFGIDAKLISPAEAGEKYAGLMRIDDLLGALWLPGDGSANASDLCQALAAGARQGGARLFERSRVSEIITDAGAVRGVKVRVWPASKRCCCSPFDGRHCSTMYAPDIGWLGD